MEYLFATFALIFLFTGFTVGTANVGAAQGLFVAATICAGVSICGRLISEAHSRVRR